MKVGLFGMVFVALLRRANCDNDDEIRAKLEAVEKRLVKMDVMEKRLAKMDAMEEYQKATEMRLAALEQQQGKGSLTLHKCTCHEKPDSG